MNLNIINQPLGQCDVSAGYAPRKKPWIPAVIMAATAIGSAVYSGIKSSQANKKAQKQLDEEKALTAAEKTRKKNENYLDTAAGQNLIRQARTEADKIWKREQGTAAMTGATERAAMAKEYGNNMVGEAVAEIAANDTARKDRVDENYTNYERSLRQQQIALDQKAANDRAQAGAQLISSLGQAAASYAGTYTGSPGGAGVTASKATSQLDSMGGGSSTTVNPYQYALQDPTFARQYGMNNYLKSNISPGYNYLGDVNLQRMMHEYGWRN